MKSRTTVSLLSFGLLLTGAMLMPRLSSAADVPDSKEANKLFSEVKSQAVQLKQDAEMLESYTRSDISRDTQVCVVDQIKEEIDSVSRQVSKLNALVAVASPWQKEAVDRIKVVTYELVTNEDAIVHNINSGCSLTSGDYASYVHANVTLSDRLLNAIKQYVDTPRAQR